MTDDSFSRVLIFATGGQTALTKRNIKKIRRYKEEEEEEEEEEEKEKEEEGEKRKANIIIYLH